MRKMWALRYSIDKKIIAIFPHQVDALEYIGNDVDANGFSIEVVPVDIAVNIPAENPNSLKVGQRIDVLFRDLEIKGFCGNSVKIVGMSGLFSTNQIYLKEEYSNE